MDKKLFKELQRFRELSSDKDYELILKSKISFYDFERLGFILESLKLIELESDLIIKHIENFQKEHKYLDKLNKRYEFYFDQEIYDKWLNDFLNNIKNENDRKYVEKMFELDSK